MKRLIFLSLIAIYAVILVAKTTKVSAMPIPMCAPDDPNACGMAQGR